MQHDRGHGFAVHRHAVFFLIYLKPHLNDMFTIDGKPNQPVRKMIMGHAKKIGLINLLKDGIKGATAL